MTPSLSHRDYAAIAFPFILSAVTLPLLGRFTAWLTIAIAVLKTAKEIMNAQKQN